MLVTTSHDADEGMVEKAARIARELGGRFVPRDCMSVAKLAAVHGDDNVLLVTERELKLYAGGGQSLFFHPGMSLVRVKRLMNGESDTVVDVSGARRGDEVLDCTAGLAADAIVFSYAVGSEGRVTAVESEPALWLLVREGLTSYVTPLDEVNAAMRRIRLVLGDHLGILRTLPDRSVDIVYFDPMFRKPVERSSAMNPLRAVANHAPLSPEAVEEARRAARRTVVMKEHRDSGEFERLGFRKLARSHSKIAYGVIRL